MRVLAIGLFVLTGTACTDGGETHHINETGSFCLTVPADFEERRITIDGVTVTEGTDLYDLVGIFDADELEVPVALTVGVNRYDPDLPSDKTLIEYVWQMEKDGTLTPAGRSVKEPESGHTYPPVAISLFFDQAHETLYFFRMDLKEDGVEELFVDIVGSFQSLR